MTGRLAEPLRLLPGYLAGHVALASAALALGLGLGLPLAVLTARRPRARAGVLAFASLVQTVPSLALLALFYPVLLGLSALARAVVGRGFPALGFLPSLLALGLYALLPILRNAVAGLVGLDPAVGEAADAVGMTPAQRFWRVEVPLAAPVAMAGVRTAAVWVIGGATLSTAVGWTGLGDYIFSGLQLENWTLVLFGCAAAAALALVADGLLALVERGLGGRRLGPLPATGSLAFGLCGLLLGAALAAGSLLLPSGSGAGRPYVLGAKTFAEQYILADLMADRLRAAGGRARVRADLGSAVAFRALAAGEIDAYVDYSGTLWTGVLGHADIPPRAELLARLGPELRRRFGVVMLGPLGFENAYVLAMRAERARSLGVASLSDLAPHAPALTLGADLEFLSRPEWARVRDAYRLDFRAMHRFQPTFMYRALQDGEADVISAFSSDGRMAADRLTALADPKGAAPSYDAVILVAPSRAGDRRLLAALRPLVGAIDLPRIQAANLLVDRGLRSADAEATALDAALSRGATPPAPHGAR